MKSVALGFDFDHTLGIDNKLESDAFVQLARNLAQARGDTIDGSRAVEAVDAQIASYRAGTCSLESAFSRAYESVLNAEAPPGSFEAYRELAVSMVPSHVEALPGVAELLKQLNLHRVPYAILTNGWNPLQQRKADHIGFTRPVFVSDDIGVRKPSMYAFNVLRDYFDIAPEQVWYVGDDPLIDIVGALGAGMRAVWFDWEERKYPTTIPAPTAIVKHVGEILMLINEAH